MQPALLKRQKKEGGKRREPYVYRPHLSFCFSNHSIQPPLAFRPILFDGRRWISRRPYRRKTHERHNGYMPRAY